MSTNSHYLARNFLKKALSTPADTDEERQVILENTLDDIGTARFLMDSVDIKDEASTGYASSFVRDYTLRFADYLTEEFASQEDERIGKRGVVPVFIRVMRNVSKVESLAFTIVRSVINRVRIESTRMVAASIFISKALKDALTDDLGDTITDDDYKTLAATLIQMFADCIPESFSVSCKFFDNKSTNMEYILSPTDAYIKLIEDKIDLLADLSTVTAPMVCPPAPWSISEKTGGFITKKLSRPIIKKRSFKGVTQAVVDELNYIQGIAYRTNKDLLGLLTELSRTRPVTLKKTFLPFPAAIPAEDKPVFEEEWDNLTDEQQNICRAFSMKCKAYKKQKDQKFSADITLRNALMQAELFKDEESIWFPHDIDYRQRAYNMIMSGLNTQGTDAQKSLVYFAKGKQITTERGAYWMKVNLANFLGKDKLHIDDRAAWVDANSNSIKHEVDHKLTSTAWHSWDKPLQGMALAIEYVRWLSDSTYEFHTAMQFDGKCNGLQHLAAISCDDKVGAEVGLTGANGDIYTYVLNEVTRTIHEQRDSAFVEQWVSSGLIARNLTKQPVMTKGYSCTLYGVKDGVKDYIMESGKYGEFTNMIQKANSMGELIWTSMESSMTNICKLMDWYKAVAKIITGANVPFQWETALGMTCTHAPLVTKTARFVTKVKGKVIRYVYQKPTDTISVSKTASSASANLTHTSDSSHLLITNREFRKALGNPQVTYVHDSFGTSYDDAQELLDSTKIAWVDLFKTDRLQEMYDYWVEYTKDIDIEIPHYSEYLTKGLLDVNSVKDSDWFFG